MSAPSFDRRTDDGPHQRGGAILLVIAAALWSLNGLFVRTLNDDGVDAWSIAGFRSLFACLALTPFVLKRFHRIADWPWVIATVVTFTLMCATFVTAMTQTTAANAIVLQYTAPAWVFLFSPWITRERATPRQAASLVFALFGVGIIFLWQFQSAEAGLVIGLTSGLVFGLQTVLFRKARSVDPMVLTWLACGGSSVLLLATGSAAGDLSVSAAAVGWLALMGLAQFAIPYVLYSAGLRRMSAQKGAMIILLEPILCPLWVWLAIGETPHGSTIVGGVFIIFSVVYLAVTDRARITETATPPA